MTKSNDGIALHAAAHPGSKPMLSDEKIEEFAIRAALGNNGGTWATHYTEAQKEHWRLWVKDLAHTIYWSMDDR